MPSIIERPPVIAVMGHVDHGKSSLLDFIRKTNIVAGEAGGITQHVAAYEVVHDSAEHGKKRITFIDTPGHAAFTAIRARGANVADIAVLVVSAEEGVKAQTLEAYKHIIDSGIPFIIAINKIDKPMADIERTKISLLEHEIVVEGYGGSIPWVGVSAKTGAGISSLLDLLLLQAELEELRADPDSLAQGFILEAHRDQKRGISATMIILNGSLESGQAVRSGVSTAPLRIIEDHTGKSLKKASFSTPITVVGFDEMPVVGDEFFTYTNKKSADTARAELVEERSRAKADMVDENEVRHILPLILKADASGSLEAIESQLSTRSTDRVLIKIIGRGLGAVTEADIKAAVAGGAQILAFSVGTDTIADDQARQYGITIKTFDIIYRLTEYAEEAVLDNTPKERFEVSLGKARVIKVFSVQKGITLLGATVFEGMLKVDGKLKVIRKGEQIGMATLVNIQSNRQSVSKVEKGAEFGAQVEANIEITENDTLEAIVFEVR